MAKLWNNQYYQNPELAGIRKTLGEAMIGSHARDVGDLRGMLTAEKTVEQVMRNRSSQDLASQRVYGDQLASLMGVQAPDYSLPAAAAALQAQASDNPEAFDYDAAAQNASKQHGYKSLSRALAGKSAWSQNPNTVSLALQVMGEAEPRRTLLKSQAGAADALTGQRENAGALDAARTSQITGQDGLVQQKLEAEIATQKAKAAYWKEYAGKRTAERGDIGGVDGVDGALGLEEAPVEIDVPWDETSFNDFTVEPVLYQSIIPLVESGSAEDITKAVAALRRYFEPKKVRYILQDIKKKLGGG